MQYCRWGLSESSLAFLALLGLLMTPCWPAYIPYHLSTFMLLFATTHHSMHPCTLTHSSQRQSGPSWPGSGLSELGLGEEDLSEHEQAFTPSALAPASPPKQRAQPGPEESMPCPRLCGECASCCVCKPILSSLQLVPPRLLSALLYLSH